MLLAELIAQIDELELAAGRADGVDVNLITFDSRQVRQGALFVALEGERVDGHQFVDQAARAGAAAVMVDSSRLPMAVDCPVLAAADTRRTLGLVGAAFYDHPSDDLCVVGVTGTNGKTTTTWIIDRLMAAADGRSGLLGTIAHRWADHRQPAINTTPESVTIADLLGRMRDDGVQKVAMEVSSHGLSTHRLRGVHFDVGIFMNLTQDHLDFHGTMDAYRAAKARLFEVLLPASAAAGKSPVALINLDDPAGDWFVEHSRARGVDTQTFGRASAADWRATRVDQRLAGTTFEVVGPDEHFAVDSPLFGGFNVSNALAAAVAARHAGCPVDQIQRGFSQLGHVPGRMQPVGRPGQPAVFVDYAHTPDALRRALQTLRPFAPARLIVVFGCGGDRDAGKRAPMGRRAAEAADLVVVTSDNPRSEDPAEIIAQIMTGIDAPQRVADCGGLAGHTRGIYVQVDRGQAIDAAIAAADQKDVVCIAGKGHEAYQEQAGERVDFDDVHRARRALARWSAEHDGSPPTSSGR